MVPFAVNEPHVIQESETRQEIIEHQLEVEDLENQIAVDKRKQEIEKQRIKEDQERTHAEEQRAWDLVQEEKQRTRKIGNRTSKIEDHVHQDEHRRA